MIAGLLDHLWQSTLFAGAIGLLMPLFRRHAASLRFWLWFTASMKFLFPFALLTMLGQHILSFLTPAAAFSVFTVIRPAAIPFVSMAAPLAAPAPADVPASDLVAVVWGAGLIAIAMLCLSRWLDLRAMLKDAYPVAMLAPVPVKVAPSFIEPGLVGIWRPLILLPVGLTQHLTAAEMDAVLAHELCHLRRRDNLLAALHMLVEGLFWFHPMVWWIGSRLCEERERACDESVVAGGVRPLVYAQGILKTCHFYVQSPLACASGVSGADLKLRVSAIITDQPIIMLSPGKALLLALVGMSALMLPLSASLLGPSPVQKIAAHIVSVLATPKLEMSQIPTFVRQPDRHILRRNQQGMIASAPSAPSIETETAMIVSLPVIRINTILDTHLPSLPALAANSQQTDNAVNCRKPQQLVNSRLVGPTVCLRTSQWKKLHADGLDISPDGKSVIRADYEKQKTLLGSSCPAPQNVGASTGWRGGSVNCF